MSKVDIKKTELVWKGKYDDEGRLVPVEKPGPYPFQIVERVNQPRIEKGNDEYKPQNLFDYWKGDEGSTFEDGWTNKLIWGDNKFVMSSLLEKFAGKIDLIYIDPPFATGADFKAKIKVGEENKEVFKEHSVIEEKAYRDTWGQGIDSFVSMLHERFLIMRELLSEKGSIFIHVDHGVSHLIMSVLDEVFGSENIMNEIIWHYRTYQGQVREYFPRKHDNIYWYKKKDSELLHLKSTRN
ncbi:MAG TPA: DNA methyltransferase [Caldisericia bacterium]|nr:DNA methyltransferase [Caldisericia bacterium]